MRKQIMALMDSKEDYAVRFMNYTNRRRTSPFSVCAFTKWPELVRFLAGHRVEVLLISESDADAHSSELEHLGGSPSVILLTEEPENDRGESSPSVWRYQSASDIMNRVMVLYGMTAPRIESEGLLKPRTRIIGVYSPVSRIGKTLFSMELAKVLAHSRSTLFLNLEAYPFLEDSVERSSALSFHPRGGDSRQTERHPKTGDSRLTEQHPGSRDSHRTELRPGSRDRHPAEEYQEDRDCHPADPHTDDSDIWPANPRQGDISDLLYYLLSGEQNLSVHLMSLIREENGVASLTPSRHPAELLKLTRDDWFLLFQTIRRDSPYESVVLDLGTLPLASPCILDECDILYMPSLSDHCSQRKIALAEANMRDYSPEAADMLLKIDFSEIISSGLPGSGTMKRALADLARECAGRDRL